MDEIVKHINDTNASYRALNAGDAKNTDLFLDNEHYELFRELGEQITVRYNKENLTKAILFIASILPRKYDQSAIHKKIPFSEAFVYDQLAFLNAFFTVDGVSVETRTQIWNARKDVPKKNGEIDSRFYFNGLLEDVEYKNYKGETKSAKFTIRNYLAGGFSDIHIKRAENGIFDVWVTNVQTPYDDGKDKELRSSIDKDSIGSNNAYLTAIRTKPFILLAGISGTGKSRIVRKLAQATDDIDQFENDDDRWKLQRPANFELIQVKPNWHNSMDVVGFKSNINGEHYEFTPFVDFIVKAWCHQDTPFFLCLDEMNLAPVEEYFAEFLSAIESRGIGDNGEFETDPIIKPFDSFGTELSGTMMHHFVEMGNDIPNSVENRLRKKGLTLPKNLIVMGTVNMDETTFSFSRKVLDRAMSIEMNEVDYDGFIEGRTEYNIPRLVEQNDLLVNRPVSAQEVKDGIEAQTVMDFLKGVNELLEGTPFKLGYRAANEAILYVAADKAIGADNIQAALDDFTLMKILSRIEGDDSKLVTKDGDKLLDKLYDLLSGEDVFGKLENSKSLAKLDSMRNTLKRDHFVSFWG